MNELTKGWTLRFEPRSKNFRAQGDQKAPSPPWKGRFASEKGCLEGVQKK
jgi:hypothetical protein